MQFAEVAVQNVRGFSPAGRFALKAGYLVLKPPTPEASPLAGLTLALFYPDGRGGDAAFVAPGAKSGKAALTFQGADGVTYRVLRELGGSGTLHRVNKATQQPELVSSDTTEIGQFLRGQAGLPPRTTFEQVYCLQPGQLPSRRPRKPVQRPEAKTSGKMPSLAAASAVAPAEDIPAAEAKLRSLESEAELAREVDAIQFKADGLSSELFNIDQKLKGTEGLKVAIAEAEAAWHAAPTPQTLGLPQDILQRVQRFSKAEARRDDALARLHSERELEAETAARSKYVEPLKNNRAFWAGLGAGVLFLVLGVVLGFNVDRNLRYVVLLDIPAFGLAAFMALRYVDDLQKASRQGSKENRFEAREKKILDEFDAEAAPVRMALKALGVEEVAEIPPALERKELLAARVAELQAQLQDMEADPEYVAAISQKQVLKEQLEEANAELSAKGTYVRDIREIEREIARTKESIVLAKAPPPAATAPDGGPAPIEPLEDPSPQLLSQAADVFTTDVLSVQGLLKERCLQYLTALTDRRYQGIEWDKEGRAFALAAGRRVPVGELPPRDLDLYYLALRMTVVEKASARVKRPFLLEDVFAGFEEVKLPLIARMLKHLGTLTQVLHVTAHPGFGQMSDGTVNV